MAGTQTYDSGGFIDLWQQALDFHANNDGPILIGFYEEFDDNVNDKDGLWTRGTISIAVDGPVVGTGLPEPETWALLLVGFGGIGGIGGIIPRRKLRTQPA